MRGEDDLDHVTGWIDRDQVSPLKSGASQRRQSFDWLSTQIVEPLQSLRERMARPMMIYLVDTSVTPTVR